MTAFLVALFLCSFSSGIKAKMRRRHFFHPPNQTILFLHLHKGAGTFLCQLAKDNGLRVSHDNCLVQRDQRCCGGDSVKEQIQFAQNTQYNFVANENYMYEAIAPSLFTHVVVLRDSWSRYVSHFRHVCRAYSLPTGKNHFWKWVQGQPDNWNLRHICGTRCISRPKFALTISDYNYALLRVQMFHHVVHLGSNHTKFLEEVSIMCRGLKWDRCSMRKKNAAPAMAKSNIYLRPPQFYQMTALDDCLFQNTTFEHCPNALAYFNHKNMKYNNPCGKKCTTY